MLPLALSLLNPQPGKNYLDLGCGEGRLMEAIVRAGAEAWGVDVSESLLERAASHGRVVRAEVPPVPIDDESVDGVAIVLVLEHLQDERDVFAEASRITREGGTLALVINHPIWTAPGSTPIADGSDEILWRSGKYFSRGWSDEPAGSGTVRFHHRSMSELVNAASDSGWRLEHMVEEGVTDAQVARTPGLEGQDHIPRLLGVRWVNGGHEG